MSEIVRKNFKLRPFRPDDALAFTGAINNDTIARDTTIRLPWSLDSVNWWIDFIIKAGREVPPTEAHFVIEINGELAGSVGIINVYTHRAEIGYWLMNKHFGNGIMTEVVGIVSDYAFKQMGLKRVFAPILTHNKASARVLEKNGFKLEGTLRNYYFKNGKYIDALSYSKVTN